MKRAVRAPDAGGGFGLPPAELAGINRWLIGKSLVTLAAAFAFSAILKVAALPSLPLGRIAAICAVAAALAPLYHLWLRSGRALGALIYTQFAADITLLTFAFASIPELPMLLHLQFLLVIVPCALLSPTCGMVMAGAAIVAHLILAAIRVPAPAAVEVLGPIYFYVMVGHQCLFYGRRMREKTREAESASAIAEALLEEARALAAAPTSAALLQALAARAREILHAEWTAVVMRDPVRGSSRIAGLVSRTGTIDDELLSWEFPAGDLPDLLIATAREDGFIDNGLHPLPELAERWRLGPYVGAVMRRAGEPLGMLLVGPTAPGGGFDPLTRPLLIGMSQQAVLALDNVRLLDDLRTASTVKSEFIGAMSHELRSPLHAIIGYLDMLEDASDDSGEEATEERREMLGRTRMYSHQLLELIEATLDLSRLEAGRLPRTSSPVALGDFFSDLRDGIPPYWRKPAVQLAWDLRPGLPVVSVDGRKLATVLRNLIHNALKFTEAGRVTVRVRVAHDLGGDVCHVEVEDTGIGISPEILPLIFEMFRQGDGTDSRRHGGVGLGLHIAKRFVDVLGGTIAVGSEVGRGTKFEVVVPVRRVAMPASPLGETADADEPEESGPSRGPLH